MLFWGAGAEIVNAFRSHTRFLEDYGFTRKDVMSQCDFRKDYALDLLVHYAGKTRDLFYSFDFNIS